MIRIGLEDVIANVFIETLKRDKQVTFIPYDVIVQYSDDVSKILSKQGETVENQTASYLLPRVFDQYPGYFQDITINGIYGIQLTSDKDETKLRNQFRGYLALKTLKAFTQCFADNSQKYTATMTKRGLESQKSDGHNSKEIVDEVYNTLAED